MTVLFTSVTGGWSYQKGRSMEGYSVFGRRGASLTVAIVTIATALVVGAAMIPVILSSTNATAFGVTGSNKTLLNLVPTIFFIVLIVGGLMEIMGLVK